ncbi:MAG: hypothetical protein K6T29_07450 [Peptococcaceae bacterium]|nr:hypothetical protein [Peptococcaceae bacterium]
MPLDVIRSTLISRGFHPEDVEYTILEVLQYKKPESLDYTDFKIISGILRNRAGNNGSGAFSGEKLLSSLL